MNFVLEEMTALRYFMPLIIEGNKRNIVSTVFVGSNSKYTSPSKYSEYINNLSGEFGFSIKDFSSELIEDVTFFVEGVGIDKIKGRGQKIILTYLRDFSVIYNEYIHKANYVIFPSLFFAEHYRTLSDKNLYIGSPKYDIIFDSEKIKNKYKIKTDKKNALIIFPLFEFLNKYQQKRILHFYNYLREMGYHIIVKSREKHHVVEMWHGDQYFEDYSWFPHTTMELISISDIVINFDSTAIKECVMMDTPVINFRNKPNSMFGFLYNKMYTETLDFEVDFQRFRKSVEKLVNVDLNQEFFIAREKYLFQPQGVSKRILDKIL